MTILCVMDGPSVAAVLIIADINISLPLVDQNQSARLPHATNVGAIEIKHIIKRVRVQRTNTDRQNTHRNDGQSYGIFQNAENRLLNRYQAAESRWDRLTEQGVDAGEYQSINRRRNL